MPVQFFMLAFISLLTTLTLATHYYVHGTFNWVYVAIAMFLSLNLLVVYWELVLFYCREQVFKESEHWYGDCFHKKTKPMAILMRSKIGLREFLTPSYWTKAWSAYSLFDKSYADKRTFGYAADVGNGFSTLIPSVILHLGLTWQFLPARVLGIIGLVMFYQMTYGTVIYWFSFLVNERQKLLNRRENMTYIVGTNMPWFAFGLIGMYAAIRLILDNDYSVIGL